MKTLYYCKTCGNLVGKIIDSGAKMTCCGNVMEDIAPQTADSTTEKHVPVISIDGNIVTISVGSTPHPMEEDHYIKFIILETDKGFQRKNLRPYDEPMVKFAITDDEKVIAAYEYCNVHRFWVAQI